MVILGPLLYRKSMEPLNIHPAEFLKKRSSHLDIDLVGKRKVIDLGTAEGKEQRISNEQKGLKIKNTHKKEGNFIGMLRLLDDLLDENSYIYIYIIYLLVL